MSEASPRPWRYGPAVITGRPGVIASDDTFVCGQLVNAAEFEEIGQANAALIVKAVNYHELLVEALEGAERALTNAVEAVDAYNNENGTHLCGGALLGMAKALNPARSALAQVRADAPVSGGEG